VPKSLLLYDLKGAILNFIDLAFQQSRIKSHLDTRIQAVLAHGNYIMGPEVKELEDRPAA
jgi:UDP-2-acetamido-2-deoxy-ribo-hexuluronate aminotransferase